jgi:hypothetical protein
MLDRSQQRLPDELYEVLVSAGRAWADKEVDAASQFLNRALELAHGLHFF